PASSAMIINRSWAIVFGAAVIAGLIVRVIAVLLAPQNSYLLDHLDNMAWSDYAFEHGPHHIYDFPEKSGIVVRMRDPRTGRLANVGKVVPHACNYPPAAAYVFWFQGALWHAVDSQIVTAPADPFTRQALGQTQVSSRVIDTPGSRFVQAL